jgi:hypothetical protein
MDPNQPQTSFIPKQPIREEKAVSTSSRSFSLVNFIAIVVFFGSLAAGGGLYFYKGIIQTNIQAMNVSLTKAKAAFEPGLITDLQVLDKRLNSSKEILGNHISISPIFRSIESLTLKSVRFSKFSYEIPKDTKKIEVTMSGQTSGQGGYRSIALQSNKLAENKYFEDIIFSNLSLTQTGGVSFDLTFTVDPNFVDFEKTVANI